MTNDPAPQLKREWSLLARFGRAEANYHDISNTWLAHGYLSSSPPTPATQSGLCGLNGEPHFDSGQHQGGMKRRAPAPWSSGMEPTETDPLRKVTSPSQRWRRNHADGIASMDLFVVPTISFQLLYGLLILQHGRRPDTILRGRACVRQI